MTDGKCYMDKKVEDIKRLLASSATDTEIKSVRELEYKQKEVIKQVSEWVWE